MFQNLEKFVESIKSKNDFKHGLIKAQLSSGKTLSLFCLNNLSCKC